MTFLSPVYLVALLGAAIPVIIHLLANRMARGREFSSLIFLKEIEQRALRWVRLQERWLLAIRISIVLLIALALARPSCGTHRAPDGTLLVMDASASMGAAEGAVWSRALRAATLVIDGFGTDIRGLAVAGSRLRLVHSGALDRDGIRERLEQLVPGVETLNVEQILSDAAAFARGRGYQRLRLALVSEFQPTNWQEHTTCPPEIEIVGVPIDGVRSNLAFGRVSLLGIAGSEHGSVEIQGSVLQFGDHSADSCSVTIRWNDVERTTTIPLHGEETIFMQHLGCTSPGLMKGELILDDRQGIVLDNKQAVALFVPNEQKVVVMGAESEETSRVALALDPTGRGESGFEVDTLPHGTYDVRKLESAHAVVVLQAPGPRESREQLLECWERGTGLVLVADSESLTEEEMSFFSRVVNGMPAKHARIGPGQPDMMPGDIHYDHPVLSPFRDFSAMGFSLPTVWRLRGWTGDQGTVLVGLQRGVPLLLECSSGASGRVMVCLTGLVPPWSDWSSRASFVPLWRRTIGYACGIQEAALVLLGEKRMVEIPCVGSDCAVSLEHPDGSTLQLIPQDVVPPVARMRLGPFLEPGLYVLRSEDRPTRLLVTEVGDSERAASLPGARPHIVERWLENQIDAKVSGIPHGSSEATRFLVLAALGMLILETYVAARSSGKARPHE
jgi:hypothetical protein